MSRQPEAGRPRADAPPYPVILGASDERRDRALEVWASLLGQDGATTNANAPELQPVTATLRALPTTASTTTGTPDAATLRLPKVGGDTATGTLPTEEETRESLRRFIADARLLLGVAPEDLSLVERVDTPAGTKLARYEQKPFRYPLRGGYGLVSIEFTPDRRIVSLTSTAIPDTERLKSALNPLRAQLTPSDAAARLAGRTFNFNDAGGREQTLTVVAPAETNVRELVVYPQRRADDPATLAFHLAWEIVLGGAAPLTVYVDALTGDVLATTPATSAPAASNPSPPPAPNAPRTAPDASPLTPNATPIQ